MNKGEEFFTTFLLDFSTIIFGVISTVNGRIILVTRNYLFSASKETFQLFLSHLDLKLYFFNNKFVVGILIKLQ